MRVGEGGRRGGGEGPVEVLTLELELVLSPLREQELARLVNWGPTNKMIGNCFLRGSVLYGQGSTAYWSTLLLSTLQFTACYWETREKYSG